ncbi:ubiquitin carboxyl-terminal hydrolase [Polychytrium aggregatum]|uniref:ubiquitin carboxyl-terminal hydrolase n=1 Tax=Polychytrium aggregatum TaxID=110093 RepID=UPI0022FF1B02|nr:ubiquitin carboxyl-terminal hydrolase [Polychytrium aggregatum]KAI9204801.1 ubiquitin carboxyl-terminal hydrolase [Polychytrium aggregatum]
MSRAALHTSPGPNPQDPGPGEWVLEATPWSRIENDPGLFTEMAAKMGIEGIQVEEVFTLEADDLAAFGTIYGLILCYSLSEESDASDHDEQSAVESDMDLTETESEPESEPEPKPQSEPEPEPTANLFFARQLIDNACGTLALINIVCNAAGAIRIGPTLEAYREFAQDFTPAQKGAALSNLHFIRDIHNSFHSQIARFDDCDWTEEDGESQEKDSEAEPDYHFVSFVPLKGSVYCMDGLQTAPTVIGPVEPDWVRTALEFIQKMLRDSSQGSFGMGFSLLAVVQDQIAMLEEQVQESKRQYRSIRSALASTKPTIQNRARHSRRSAYDDARSETHPNQPSDDHKLGTEEHQAGHIRESIRELESKLAQEKEKRRCHQEQNALRRFDYSEFIAATVTRLIERGLPSRFTTTKSAKKQRSAGAADRR